MRAARGPDGAALLDAAAAYAAASADDDPGLALIGALAAAGGMAPA